MTAIVGIALATSLLPIGTTTVQARAAASITSGTHFGAYVQTRGTWSRADQEAAVNNLETFLGRKLDIDHYYYKFKEHVFPNFRQAWDIENDRIPMISWSAVNLAEVLNGTYDQMIRDRANGLEALGAPVLLRWFYEMDAVIYQGREIQSPAQYIQAWRHIHDIFEAEGATNVEWVWSPNAFNFATGFSQQFFPGDKYVDWIAADGYNWAPGKTGASWNSFKNIFSAFYSWAAPKSQPLMIAETGVQENNPGDKAAWVADMATTLKFAYPEIKALVYFDAYASANFGGMYDFRVDTSASAYQAFRTLANDPYFDSDFTSVDASPPSAPSNLQATISGASVDLSWTASTDDLSVIGYDVYRDGSMVGTVASSDFIDSAVAPGSTYSYAVRARDGAGNPSSLCSAVSVTVPASTPAFADGFESGSMGAWTNVVRISAKNAGMGNAQTGSFVAESVATGGDPSYASKTLPIASTELYARTSFRVDSQGSTMNLLRLQTPAGTNIYTVFVSKPGELMFRNDVRGTVVWSPTKMELRNQARVRHQVRIRVKVGTSGQVEVWFDGQRVGALSMSQNLGTAMIGRLVLGDNVKGRTYRALFDDLAAGPTPVA